MPKETAKFKRLARSLRLVPILLPAILCAEGMQKQADSDQIRETEQEKRLVEHIEVLSGGSDDLSRGMEFLTVAEAEGAETEWLNQDRGMNAEPQTTPGSVVCVSIFVAENCDSCAAVEQELIPQLKQRFGDALKVRCYSIEDPKNYDLLLYLEQQFSYLEGSIPVAFVGKEVLRGRKEITENLGRLVEKYLTKGGCDFPVAIGTTGKEKQEQHKDVYIAYFYGPGCRRCDRVNYMLNRLQHSYPNLRIRRFNCELKENMKLNEALCELFHVPEQERLIVPSIFVGDVHLAKEELTDGNIRELIEKYKDKGTMCPWAPTNTVLAKAERGIIQRFRMLGPFAVITAGLIDGINPCAFATLIFFLSYLTLVGRKGKDLVFAALGFTTAVFIVYFLIGLGMFRFIHSLRIFSLLSRVIYLIAAVLAFVLGTLSLYDFRMAKKGDYSKVKLQLPSFLKNRIHQTIREKSRSSKITLAAFATGAVVSFLELECTGQVYLPTICFVVGVSELKTNAIFYLALYNLMFILPLLAIFLLAYFGTTSERIALVMKKRFAAIKIITALFFFSLGFFLVALLL